MELHLSLFLIPWFCYAGVRGPVEMVTEKGKIFFSCVLPLTQILNQYLGGLFTVWTL